MIKLNWWKTVFLSCVFSAVEVITSPAQIANADTFAPEVSGQADFDLFAFDAFKTLVSFNGSDGIAPLYVSLVQGTDGNFYGTTEGGGANHNGECQLFHFNGCGTVFKMTPAGTLTTLHSFDGTSGAFPSGELVLATNGNFYGTTESGGAYDRCTENGVTVGCGTVFKMTPAGTLTTLHSFDDTDGSFPSAGLVQGTDGNFYGTTESGGAYDRCTENGVTVGCGTVFKMTPAGTLTTLHSFDDTDGSFPSAGLVQATDGNFYGTTSGGGTGTACGTRGCGTIFKITPGGMLTTLHSFDYTDGDEPVAGLVQATDGNIYGTTALGGPTCGGGHGCGTVFKITTGGKLTTLYTFCSKTNCTDGEVPFAALVQATDGNFYGTTNGGGTGTACGTSGCGTVFKITPGGMLTTLHSFDSTDGYGPTAGPVQGTNGNFYGTTDFGGVNGDGTIFSLSVGLGPFVETDPTSGKVGTDVIILGNNLTGASSVTFNGTKAAFTVNSTGTAIKTTVPSGATTGKVKVTTPSRTLTSTLNFRVTPTISSFSPTSGPPGASIVINGESFTGATSVTFGGVKATFTVDSSTKITATVPSGAKTGKITVTAPGGTATSSGTFTVT